MIYPGTLQLDFDAINLKTKLNLKRSGEHFEILGFNEKSFFIILLGFTQFWDFKHSYSTHFDSPAVHTSDEILILSTIDIILLKRDDIDGSVVNGLREAILFSFVLDKPSGYKVSSQPEVIHSK